MIFYDWLSQYGTESIHSEFDHQDENVNLLPPYYVFLLMGFFLFDVNSVVFILEQFYFVGKNVVASFSYLFIFCLVGFVLEMAYLKIDF